MDVLGSPSLIILTVSVYVKQHYRTELRSCVEVEVAVLGSSLCVRKATLQNRAQELCGAQEPSWAPSGVPNGSSFEWYQPCKNKTALQLHHVGGYSKHAVKSYSRSFRVIEFRSCVKVEVAVQGSRP